MKKEMLDERRFPKMHLNLQRLLQVVSLPNCKWYCLLLGLSLDSACYKQQWTLKRIRKHITVITEYLDQFHEFSAL